MKSIRTLIALALATSFASASFAAGDTTPALITVPKNEAAIQENKAVTARDAANNPATPTGHKTKAASAGHKTKAAPTGHTTKAAPAGHKTKAAPTGHKTKAAPAAQKTKAAPAKGKSAKKQPGQARAAK